MKNKQTLEEQLDIIDNNIYNIKYIENPFEEVQLKAVKYDGLAIQFIKNPSEEVQLEAVKNFELSIKHIEKPSEEVQLLAVKFNCFAIKHIKNPPKKVQKKALNKNLETIKYIKNYKKSSIIRENWGTYAGKLILFKFEGIKYVNAGCFTTYKYKEFKTMLLQQQKKYSKYFTDKEDIQLVLKEVKEYLTN